MRGLAIGIVGFSTVLLPGAPALAAEPPKAAQPAELVPKVMPTTKSFYGWEILATGEVGAVLAAAGVLIPGKPLDSVPATAAFVVGAPLFVIGGPVAHWTHGDFTKGMISFSGNAVLPLIGGFVGHGIACSGSNPSDDCASRGFFTGMVVSAMVVPVIDAIALGWEDVPVSEARARETQVALRSVRGFSIAPWSSWGAGGFRIGVSGGF
jgi:hypothetical protein